MRSGKVEASMAANRSQYRKKQRYPARELRFLARLFRLRPPQAPGSVSGGCEAVLWGLDF